MRTRLQTVWTSTGTRHGLIMTGATLVAGGFDYVTNVLIGRGLGPADFLIFVTVTAILQLLVHGANVIRNVVAFYTAELSVKPAALMLTGRFLRRSWRWAWRWGGLAMIGMAFLAPLLADLLKIETTWPLWAGTPVLFLLFLRPVTDGALQGRQQFLGLGSVQTIQALLRLLLAPLLIWWGLRATGAILSLPLAMAGALLLALWLLRQPFRAVRIETDTGSAVIPPVSWRYSTDTLLGFIAFASLINMDAIVVNNLFSSTVAASYGPVVTLGKINLFISTGVGMVLFPKVTQRRALGLDPRPVLLMALAAALLPGLLLTTIYFFFSGPIVHIIFTTAYSDPGLALGMAGLATTLYAGVNIWLNYALSAAKRPYIFALALIVTLQAVGIGLFHGTLVAMTAVMAVMGFIGNLTGIVVSTVGDVT
jgi:O-antigen/teichoic acid export membrane protein